MIIFFPSGRVARVQGYESNALDILLQQFQEEDLVIGKGEVPEIWYDLSGQRHRYFPDIYVPKEKLIIEVKCQWTYNKDLDTFTKNIAKRDGTIRIGYKHLFMIFNSQGTKLLTELKW
jgi:hypothetical protein